MVESIRGADADPILAASIPPGESLSRCGRSSNYGLYPHRPERGWAELCKRVRPVLSPATIESRLWLLYRFHVVKLLGMDL